MLPPMVYTMTSSIGAHIYTPHNAHDRGIDNNKFDRCTPHHAHNGGINDDKFDRCTYTYTTCSRLWYRQ